MLFNTNLFANKETDVFCWFEIESGVKKSKGEIKSYLNEKNPTFKLLLHKDPRSKIFQIRIIADLLFMGRCGHQTKLIHIFKAKKNNLFIMQLFKPFRIIMKP